MSASAKWSPDTIQNLIQHKFPRIRLGAEIESQLSSLEIMELLLALEEAFGFGLHAIELEPLLNGDFPGFCQIVNAKK